MDGPSRALSSRSFVSTAHGWTVSAEARECVARKASCRRIMTVSLPRPWANRSIGADNQDPEKDGNDHGPHGWQYSGESSNSGQHATEAWRSRQHQGAGDHQSATTDERGEPEPEAPIPSADEADCFRDAHHDEQATKDESQPPTPAAHLRTGCSVDGPTGRRSWHPSHPVRYHTIPKESVSVPVPGSYS